MANHVHAYRFPFVVCLPIAPASIKWPRPMKYPVFYMMLLGTARRASVRGATPSRGRINWGAAPSLSEAEGRAVRHLPYISKCFHALLFHRHLSTFHGTLLCTLDHTAKVQSSSSWSCSLTSLLETDRGTEVSHHSLRLLLLCSVE